MGQIVNLRSKTNRDPQIEKIRLDVADLIQALLYDKESELGRPVSKRELLPIDVCRLAFLQGLRVEKVEELGGVLIGNPWADRDVKVPGLFNCSTRTITVAEKEPLEQQRFTIGHELGHALYHSGPVHLRERAARAASSSDATLSTNEGRHKAEEREANVFAAEVLMPAELVGEAMTERFGGRIDGTVPHDELAYFLSIATRQKISAGRLSQMPQVERAKLFAVADNVRGRFFEPLTRLFGVSAEAMAIRLLELDLVS